MKVPTQPKIYHIVHVDRLSSIVEDGVLWCDAQSAKRVMAGTTIGMSHIKQNRLKKLLSNTYTDLCVGDCVPFYFCPRSVMLYLIHQANHFNLQYRGGQGPIVHLEADLKASVAWANQHNHRWAFTLSNAAAHYAEDRNDLAQLNEINWEAIEVRQWGGNGVSPLVREGKQAEFLMENSFPWNLVERIGVDSQSIQQQVLNAILSAAHRPRIEIVEKWYY